MTILLHIPAYYAYSAAYSAYLFSFSAHYRIIFRSGIYTAALQAFALCGGWVDSLMFSRNIQEADLCSIRAAAPAE